MSTSSLIAKKIETGKDKDKIQYIYCHHDGYPAGVGEILFENYNSQKKIDELISLGHLSALAGSPRKSYAYHRNANQPLVVDMVNSIEEFNDLDVMINFKYLWKDNKWYVTKNWRLTENEKDKIWIELTEKIITKYDL